MVNYRSISIQHWWEYKYKKKAPNTMKHLSDTKINGKVSF